MVKRSAWLVAAAVAAVVAVVEAPIVLAGRTWADRAYQTEVVPSRAAAADAWAAGRLPEWWDGTGLGVPLAAEPSHGAMYPLLAVVGAAPDDAPAIDLMLVVHALLAAIGLALWARRRGADDVVAVVAGAGLAASGALHAALLAGGVGVAWLPWVAWAAEGVAAPDEAPLGVGARRTRLRRAVAIAAAVGAAGLAGSTAAAIDAVIVAIAIAAGAAREVRRALVWTVAACAVGAVACAVAWLPAIVHRMGDVAATGAVAPHRDELLGWLAPAGAARFHLGAAWLALALFAVIAARRVRAELALAVAAAAALALAWAPALAWGDPATHVAAASMIVIALGAAGLDRLAAGLDRRAPRVIGSAAGTLDVRAAAALGAAAVVIAAALSARHAGAIASVGELAAIAALALAWPRGGGVQLAAALLVVGPGLLVLRDTAPLVARSALAGSPTLAPRAGVRVYRPVPMDPDDADPAQRARDDHATIAGDVVARFGAATAQTTDPGRRAIEDAVWRAAGLSGGKLFDRYGIEEAILPATVVEAMSGKPLAQRGRWALTDARPARPRAYVARRTRGATTPEDEVVATFPGPDERGTPLDTVAIAGAVDDGEHATVIVRCTRTADAPERVVVGCERAPAGWAVVTDAWAPGWSATVDGRDADVRRADALVRAVHVDAGDHEIVWRYRAPWLRLGLALSGLAWVHLALLAWLARRRRAPARAV